MKKMDTILKEQNGEKSILQLDLIVTEIVSKTKKLKIALFMTKTELWKKKK